MQSIGVVKDTAKTHSRESTPPGSLHGGRQESDVPSVLVLAGWDSQPGSQCPDVALTEELAGHTWPPLLHGVCVRDVHGAVLGVGQGGSKRLPRASAAGTWRDASVHLITVLIGGGVLGLPRSLAWFGWVVGIPVFFLFFAMTMWTARMLTDVVDVQGVKRRTYRELVKGTLGRWHACVLTGSQFLFGWMASVGYTIAGAASLRYVVNEACSIMQAQTCHNHYWFLILAFAAVQLILAPLPNLESVWWVSAMGASMSLGYSTLAIVLGGMSDANYLGSLWGITADPSEKAWSILACVGNICFAFNCLILVVEIQATLREPPASSVSMKKSLWAGLGSSFILYLAVAITNYMALGNMVPEDTLLGYEQAPTWISMLANVMVALHMVASARIFNQALYEFIDQRIADRFRRTGGNDRTRVNYRKQVGLKVLYRCTNVIIVSTIALLLPFFGDIIGLIGAVTYYPTAVLYPMLTYYTVHRPGRSWKIKACILNVLLALVSSCAAVASLRSIVLHASKYHVGNV